MPQSSPGARLTRRSITALLLLGVSLVAFALVACGGGDDEENGDGTPSATTTSTASSGGSGGSGGTATATASGTSASSGASANTGSEEGNSVAHNAMISEQDLPGTGWSVVSTDEFGGSLLDADQSDLSDAPACQPYVAKITSAAKQAEESRVGRASKSLTKTDALLGASIDVEVAVYNDSKTASDLISQSKDAFSSKDFEDCFREIIRGSETEIPEDVQFTLTSIDPQAPVPHDGIAQAFDLELSSGGVTFSLQAEVYAWADGNATAIVTAFGTPDSMSADVVQAAVSKTDEKLSAAQ